MARKITVYGTPSCRAVRPVLAILEKSSVPYKYVDIQADLKADERVRTINNGNASVPTIVFRDGSTLTEPRNKQLIAKLEDSGYTVQQLSIFDRIASFFSNSLFGILGIIDIILGTIMETNNLVVLGFVFVALYLFFGRILPFLKARR